MEHDRTVWVAAAEFVKRHGVQAPELAQEWSQALADREETDAAAMCSEIAEAASELLRQRSRY
jgi:cobalamin-dependent methionine synthase I